MSDSIRLQKRIADNGYCSRRKAEALIEEGYVKVNGKVVTRLGSKVKVEDKIEIKGKLLKFTKDNITIALYKPAGYVCTKSDPKNSNTIMKLLPPEYSKLKPIGRLDQESEGLLLLSTDGELIQKLTHPKFNHTKRYEIKVKGWPKDEHLAAIRTGKFKLGDYTLKPMEFKILRSESGRKTWISITLTEGRNRQIRRVMDSLGFPVLYLRRIAIGKLTLSKLKKSDFKILTPAQIQKALE